MSRALPPLDMHAHVDVGVPARSLEGLGAVVFAATRSLDEFAATRRRSDQVTIWGVGCHPGIAKAQREFDAARFGALLIDTPFVSEVGLDGASAVAMDLQQETFKLVLAKIRRLPRLTSVHSKRATTQVLDLIEAAGARGIILHWWLGSIRDTERALRLGCLFSVNSSMDIAKLGAAGVPLDAVLPETDHPSGNRKSTDPKQPGRVIDVERALAVTYGVTPDDVREQSWRTLARISSELDLDLLFPMPVQRMLTAARGLQSSGGVGQ